MADLIRSYLADSVRSQFNVTLPPVTPATSGVIVYDYALAGADGIRDLARTQPVVALTSGDEQEGLDAVAAGAADYLARDNLTTALLERAVLYALDRASHLQALQTMEMRFQRTVHGVRDGVWDWDLQTGMAYFSPRWCNLVGYQGGEVTSTEQWFSMIHPDDFPRFKERFDAHVNGATPVFKHEYRIATKAGLFKWMLVRGIVERDSVGRAIRIAGSQTDVDKQKLTEARILYDAQFDRVTGLVNRFHFLDELSREFDKARANPEYRFAVMLLDLDRFKFINDSQGHAVGDQILLAVGQRITANLRGQDVVGRYGGDEFVALVRGVPAHVASTYAQGVVEAFREPFRIEKREYRHSISIGITTASADSYEAPEDVIRDADIAMHRAKALGRNRYVVFDEPMRADLAKQFGIERDLRTALYRDDLSVHYQPIVSMATGKPISFEALARWYHATRGWVSPVDFIPVAEDTGLIHEIGEFVLDQSCIDVSQWKYTEPVSVSVNVSPKQFTNKNLVGRFKKAVTSRDLPAGTIGVEVTESALMEDEQASIATMKAMRRANFFVHLDDFGTGYSALHSIMKFPLDGLKIDQSFVRSLGEREHAKSIIQTIVQLAHNLGIYVVAEGVETKAHWNTLKALGVDFAQGYYIAKPMPTSDVQTWLASRTDES